MIRAIPGSATGITVSVLNESTSLASTQSRRSRARAVSVAGSESSSPVASLPGSAVSTCRNTASSKSMPPRCSTPSGGPAGSWQSPRPRGRAPRRRKRLDPGRTPRRGRLRSPAAPGVGHRGGLRLGAGAGLDVAQAGQLDRLVQQVAFCIGPALAGWVTHTWSGGPPCRSVAAPKTHANSRAVSA